MQAFLTILGGTRPFENVAMNTLYDLFGVRRDADHETLKRAFHKVVKATYPDLLHAGGTDALSRFWQIAVADGILRDAEQRTAFGRLLSWERQQLRSKWRRIIVCQTIAVAVLTVTLAIRGYSLLIGSRIRVPDVMA